MKFEVSEHHEMLALFRAVVEAKFQAEPVDDDLPASTILASVAERLCAALRDAEEGREGGDARRRWDEWCHLDSNRREWSAAVGYAKRAFREAWPRWSVAERDAACRALLSPFTLASETLEEFKNAAFGGA